MDNYKVAISGTNLAAQILGIEAPKVQFFCNQNYSKKGYQFHIPKREVYYCL